MAERKIVNIDEELCDGCGECVPSCAEGAIQIIDGKARLVADNLCDGLGACLGECPQDAITVIERDADEFDEDAVEVHLGMAGGHSLSTTPGHQAGLQNAQLTDIQSEPEPVRPAHGGGGCPGSRMMQFGGPGGQTAAQDPGMVSGASQLRQWPVQLHLVAPTAPYLQEADLLLAADCCAFAVGDFHERFLKGKALAVACPKLDQGMDIYLQKLIAMIDQAKINTLSVAIMEVPCCGGLLGLAQEAVKRAQRKVPLKQIVVGVQGNTLREEWC